MIGLKKLVSIIIPILRADESPSQGKVLSILT
jgi:hypothetical protein